MYCEKCKKTLNRPCGQMAHKCIEPGCLNGTDSPNEYCDKHNKCQICGIKLEKQQEKEILK